MKMLILVSALFMYSTSFAQIGSGGGDVGTGFVNTPPVVKGSVELYSLFPDGQTNIVIIGKAAEKLYKDLSENLASSINHGVTTSKVGKNIVCYKSDIGNKPAKYFCEIWLENKESGKVGAGTAG